MNRIRMWNTAEAAIITWFSNKAKQIRLKCLHVRLDLPDKWPSRRKYWDVVKYFMEKWPTRAYIGFGHIHLLYMES